MSEDVVTPADLGRTLGVSPKKIRDVLRARYGRLTEHGATRWHLTAEQIDYVRRALSR
ncbi:hypothetical protein [Cellulosimicrobium cellulans]|uniref:hypothetical protein n=1 Tax=Cellulosimicrobium cellulans TaxID=1710 RepID=UPI0014834E4A|nr:hypothetical protein [Cellulosimicrobium cellulans]